MARYEHLPVYLDALNLAVHFEKTLRTGHEGLLWVKNLTFIYSNYRSAVGTEVPVTMDQDNVRYRVTASNDR